jgi:hypothetical protein
MYITRIASKEIFSGVLISTTRKETSYSDRRF